MDILIATVYNSLNFGAFLQAKALERFLINKNHNVTFLCLDPHDLKFHLNYYKSKNPIRIYKRFITEMRFNNVIKEFKTVEQCEKEYDLAIIGSDKLWNVLNSGFDHRLEYVGGNIKAIRIITYAVSCNKSSSTDFLKIYPSVNGFDKIDLISVRDKMTLNMVKRIAPERTVTRVLDPTFLIDYNEVEKVSDSQFILIYGYRFLEKEQEEIMRFARKNKLKLYSIGFDHKWCDKYINCDPKVFLRYVRSATYVITSTFHGTVFSIIFRKQFASYVRNNPKVDDLLQLLHLDNRNASNSSLLDVLSHELNYSNCEEILRENREYSMHYLKEAGC